MTATSATSKKQLLGSAELSFARRAFRFGKPMPLVGTVEFEIRVSKPIVKRQIRLLALDRAPGFTAVMERDGSIRVARYQPGERKNILVVGTFAKSPIDATWHRLRFRFGAGQDYLQLDEASRSVRTVPYLASGNYGTLVLNPDRVREDVSIRNFRLEPWFPQKIGELQSLLEHGLFRRAQQECRVLLEFAGDGRVRQFAEDFYEQKLIPVLLKEDANRSRAAAARRKMAVAYPEMVEVPSFPRLKGQSRLPVPTFYMDRMEVSQKEYERFLKYMGRTHDHGKCHPAEPANKEHAPDFGKSERAPNLPVHGTDWFDAYAYAAWAGKRLPTVQEWQLAARGVSVQPYPWGKQFAPSKVNLSGKLAPVVDYAAGRSPYGCLQMVGNVSEWCADSQGQGRSMVRPLCGGSIESQRSHLNISRILARSPLDRSGTNGFRCVMDPPGK